MANNDRKEISATIRDVAKAAGVSPATVSRYYSGSSVVGTELSNQIENAAEKLGYIHKYRKRKDRGVIALLLSDLELSFYGDVVKEILEQISRYRYRLIIIPYSNEESDYKHFITEMNIEGVIYLDENINPDILKYIHSKNIKTIMCGGVSQNDKVESVHVNDLLAAYEGMKYLIKLKHEKILVLSDFENKIGSTFQRLMGCRKALEEYSLQGQEELIAYGKMTYEMGYRLTEKTLKAKKEFTAVFAFSDEMAMGAIKALIANGLEVPRDVSVLGFDDIAFAEKYNPPLTTIHQPIKAFVTQCLDFFMNETEHKTLDIMFPFRIIERSTCAENQRV